MRKIVRVPVGSPVGIWEGESEVAYLERKRKQYAAEAQADRDAKLRGQQEAIDFSEPRKDHEES